MSIHTSARGASRRVLEWARALDRLVAGLVVAGPRLRGGIAVAALYLVGAVLLAVPSSRFILFYLLVGFGALVLLLDWWAYPALLAGWLVAAFATPHGRVPGVDVAFSTIPVLGLMLVLAVRKLREVTLLERQVEAQNLELQMLMLQKVSAERVREEYLQALSAQLALARRVQEGLMACPKTSMCLDGLYLGVSGVSRASMQVGGDFYRVLRISPTAAAVVVGDVMGKGVAAALVMTMTVALFEDALRHSDDPCEVLQHVNLRLHTDLGVGDQFFVTAAVLVIDARRRSCRIANAGHEAPLLVRGGRVRVLGPRPGLPLGVDTGEAYEARETGVREGDHLVAYTDGLVQDDETRLPGLGRRALRRALARAPLHDAAAALEALPPSATDDDVTLVSVHLSCAGCTAP